MDQYDVTVYCDSLNGAVSNDFAKEQRCDWIQRSDCVHNSRDYYLKGKPCRPSSSDKWMERGLESVGGLQIEIGVNYWADE
jgi:hypothetical protein